MMQPRQPTQSDSATTSEKAPEKSLGDASAQDATAAAPTQAADPAAALGRIPSGLFVVTWRGREGGSAETDRAMLASWVMQGGFVPPLITIAVGTSRDLLAAIDQCIPFVVNVLGESQRPLVARFGRPAGPGEDPFAGLAVDRSPTGTAVIPDASAWLECQAVTQAGVNSCTVAIAVGAAAVPVAPPSRAGS